MGVHCAPIISVLGLLTMIKVKGISKQYGNKKAIDNISFTVYQGEILGLLGLNGAGKSTIMNIITGCLAATEGTVLIDGRDISKNPIKAKERIGYLPETPPLYVNMRVREYLNFICDLKKIKQKRKLHMEEVYELAGIGHVQNRVIKNLSKGYRQRVGLAASLIGNPEVLILDEPTVGLDPTQIIEIRNLIREMGKSKTIIFSSHILSEVQAICERVIVLNDGKIAADVTPKNLHNTTHSSFNYIASIEGEPESVLNALKQVPQVINVVQLSECEPGVYEYQIEGQSGNLRRAVFFALSEAELPLLSTRGAQMSLEDIFMQLVGGYPQSKGGEQIDSNI